MSGRICLFKQSKKGKSSNTRNMFKFTEIIIKFYVLQEFLRVKEK
jgi:hypothetical protein